MNEKVTIWRGESRSTIEEQLASVA